MAKQKISDEQAIADWMAAFQHPNKDALVAVADLLRNSHPEMKERIKWAAPSYHLYGQDLVTFNHRHPSKVHLVFHHPGIVEVKSDLLEGEYKDRRMAYLDGLADVEAKAPELRRIMAEYTGRIDQ